MTLPASGFHYGVPFEVYSSWDAINFSRLKPIINTASKCKWEMDHPKEPTPAMILGSALHLATLEPARFDQMYYVCPACDRRTKEGKEEYAKHEKEAAGRILIRKGSDDGEKLTGEVEKLKGMAASLHARKSSRTFLSGAGQNEVSMLWRDEETGLICKGRLDRLIDPISVVIVEIKSCRDASAHGFGRDCASRYYDAQAAHYRNGYKAITGKSAAHVFLAVENSAPFDAQTHLLDDEGQRAGERRIREMLNRYAECVKSGEWPGYPDKVNVLHQSDWAGKEIYTE